MEKTVIRQLEESQIQGAATILTNSFISMNTIWKHYKLSYQDVYSMMRGKIIPGQNSKVNFVLLQNQKLIGVSIAYDMIQYLTSPEMPNNIEFFKKLGQVGKVLQKNINLNEIKRGDIIYGLYAVIDPEYASKGYSLRFWWESLLIAKLMGYKYYYSRLSSPYSLKILQKLGAEILADYELVENNLKQKFWLVRIDFSKPLLSYQQVKRILQKKSQKSSL